MYGRKLKQIIKSRGYSQKDIAKLINVPESSFSSWINMDIPPTEIIMSICMVLNIELWEFFMDENAYKKLFNIPKEYLDIIKKISDIRDDNLRIRVLSIIDNALALAERS